ncbi:MAG: hypothetical protein K2R98_05955 [Gemmataceae bacterium]|nr:hypothetical protein [Gemmataceae bacterium]
MRDVGPLRCYFGASGIQRGHWRLCIGPLILRMFDYGLTLFGQPAAYWGGNFAYADEGSPVLHWGLQQHPLMFVAVAVAITAPMIMFILCWPRKPAAVLAAFIMLAHITGVASWILTSPLWGPVACFALVLFSLSVMEASEEALAAIQVVEPLAAIE